MHATRLPLLGFDCPAAARLGAARLAAACLVALLSGCAGLSTAPLPDYAAIVAAPDRSDADRQVDPRRKQPQLIAFTEARPGMRVLDMAAGGGYTTELLARIVGPKGVVFSQDSAEAAAGRPAPVFNARMKKDVMKNVVRTVRPYDDPLPPDVRNLDLITFFFSYHDIAYMNVDREQMNRRLFAALKPGGVLVVADHSAKPGEGVSVARSLHRIDERVMRRELETAGFRLVSEADFLRSPADPRDAIVFRPKVPVDEFVLKFEKPR